MEDTHSLRHAGLDPASNGLAKAAQLPNSLRL
jgi:hypothetical protein